MGRSNLFNAILSLIAVLICFAAYSFFLVPWIEPPPRLDEPMNAVASRDETYHGQFSSQFDDIFPADSWELDSPRVLHDQKRKTTLLFKRYEIDVDGGVRITPCTLVYGSDKRDANGNELPPLILQAPDGATVYFDRPVNFNTGQAGDMQSGQLRGHVRISRLADSTGRGKLIVETSNVQINSEGLLTPNDLTFEYENSYGSGRDLIVRIDKQVGTRKLEFDSLRTIELVTLHKLYLNPENADPIGVAKEKASSSASQNRAPTLVTCDGPCQIDLQRNTLSFEQNVDLRRLNVDAAPDILQCDNLTLFFDKQATVNGQSSDRRVPKFEVHRVLATGNPVVLNAPSRFAYLRGSRLEYDLRTRRFRMSSATQSSFRHVDDKSEHRLIAPRIEYTAGDADQIGNLHAVGPGRFDAVEIEPHKVLAVKWTNRLSLVRETKNYLMTIEGDVKAEMEPQGRIQAEHVDIWLRPADASPSPSPALAARRSDAMRLSLQPVRTVATGRVDFDSPQLTAQCQKLETAFTQSTAPTPQKPVSTTASKKNPPTQRSATEIGRFTSERTTPVALPRQETEQQASADGRIAGDRKFQLTGNDITIQVTTTGQQITTVDEVRVDGKARFRELPIAGANVQTLAVDADAFRLDRPDRPNAFVQAIGEPTVISTDGIKIIATNVQLDKEKNLVWSKGKGKAILPVQRDFEGNVLPEPEEATVTWNDEMEFDGMVIQLHGQAVARGPTSQLQADHLQAELTHRVDFSKKGGKRPDVERITAQDNVMAVHETFEFGKRTSSIFMRVPNISLHTATGDVQATGSGQIILTKVGFQSSPLSNKDIDPKSGALALRQRDESQTDDAFTFVEIEFQSEMRGNLNRRILEFHRKVEVLYGPVYGWNQRINRNDPLEENDIQLTADQLILAQGNPDSAGARPIDLRASGNVYVRGKSFQATGDRVSYDQLKDMLVLKGNAQMDARIRYRQADRGAEVEKSGSEFRYFPHSRRAVFNEFRSLEFRTFGK